MDKRQGSNTVGENVNWCSHYEEVWRFLKKLKIELSYDPAVPLLGMHLNKTLIPKDKCTAMFTAQ